MANNTNNTNNIEEVQKITNLELAKLQDIQNKSNQINNKIVSLNWEEVLIKQKRLELESEMIKLKSNEYQILNELEAKYGKVNIDITTGNIEIP